MNTYGLVSKYLVLICLIISRKQAMTIDKAREIIKQQISFGSGYNRNAVRLLLGEVQREHGMQAGDKLIEELNLEQAFGLRPGTDFTHVAH
jgi:hypothetical protein